MAFCQAMHRESYPVNPLEEKTLTSESNQDKPGHTEILTRYLFIWVFGVWWVGC